MTAKTIAGRSRDTGKPRATKPRDVVCAGEIVITAPEDLPIHGGVSLYGRRLRLVRDGDAVRCTYEFLGGGEMLIFDVSENSLRTIRDRPAGKTPSSRQGERR